MTNELKISKGTKRILDTMQQDLFPSLSRLRELLVRIQKFRISSQLYSTELHKLELEYSGISTSFFTIVKKLETPDILFEGLEGESQNMIDYFQWQNAFSKNLDEGSKYIEIIDRTLDRKNQSIQNNRTFVFALLAIFISLISLR